MSFDVHRHIPGPDRKFRREKRPLSVARRKLRQGEQADFLAPALGKRGVGRGDLKTVSPRYAGSRREAGDSGR